MVLNKKHILVSVESYNPVTDEAKHISVWELDRTNLRELHKIFRRMFKE